MMISAEAKGFLNLLIAQADSEIRKKTAPIKARRLFSFSKFKYLFTAINPIKEMTMV